MESVSNAQEESEKSVLRASVEYSPVLDAALAYVGRGWSIIPVLQGTKRPPCKWEDFQKRLPTEAELRQWFGPGNGKPYGDLAVVLGQVSGRLVVRDFDQPDAYDRWRNEYQDLAVQLPTVKTSRGHHVYFRLAPGSSVKGIVKLEDGELRADGGIVVLPPSRHPSGAKYEWIVPLPEDDLVVLDPAEVGLLQPKSAPQKSDSGNIVAEGQRNSTLTSIAGLMRRRGMDEDSIRSALLRENTGRCHPPLPEREVEAIAKSVSRYPPVYSNSQENEHLTDLGNARRLMKRHGYNLRYASHLKKWLAWDGTRWECDGTGIVERLAKETVISIYAEAATASDENSRKTIAKWAQQSESEKRIQATINLAVSEPGIIVKPDQLDTDDWLLNCTNGTLDLRTGHLRPHTRDDLLTKRIPVEYNLVAKCPEWLKFLDRVLSGSQPLIGFLRRAVGYSLTGITNEHVMFILHGTGRNGKSTFLETIRALLGDYAQHTPTETLMIKRSGSILNDVARLKGARLVTASETEDGQRLAEATIKQLTGGDTITARFLHREFFEFKPAFKLFLAANHKPVIRGTDHAIWERIRLIPFKVTISEDEQDKELPAKLLAELPGVLRWAVQGCRDWQNQGLGESVEVKTATADYRSEMDALGEFIEQCCIKRPDARVGVTDFYQNYRQWCEKTGEKPLTQAAFSERLFERGFEKKKSGTMIWLRVGLLDSRPAATD